jgi:hypothetical protein
MNITLCSSFRNSTGYLQRYFRQCDALDTLLFHAGHRLSFIWAEGDSRDSTMKMLHAARWRFKVQIVEAHHGGPAYGSIENVARFAQLAYVANKVWEVLPAEADVIVWAESDLIWEPAMMLRLIEWLNAVPVVGCMVMDGPNSFYDVWAYRRNGQRFTKQPPYHADIAGAAGGLLEMDSIGSIVVMRGDVARAVYVPMEDVLVGTCRMIRELGHSVWLDTGAVCHHP